MPRKLVTKNYSGAEQPEIKILDPLDEVNKRFDFYIKVVIGILVFTVLTMLVMVATLVVDSFHFNSVTYQQYSDKLNDENDLKDLINRNQSLIIENQKQIEDLLKK